ncbi:MAG: hypothetical protein ACD_10C00851G0004 [uncultured bacterium]|nr:MAG: hypothetical protein ACD_10C00851G0004 [uncultured bacterium]
MLNQHPTNNSAIGPLSHLNNTALRPPLAVDAHNPHQSAVTMQHLGHLMLGQKNIGTAIIGNQKAIAILMPLNFARRQASSLR